MNLLDIGILIVISLTTVRSFFRGIIQEASALFGIIAGFLIAFYYYKDLAFWLARFVSDYKILLGIFCFIIIFILCLFFIHFLAIILRGAIRLVLMGWLDRALGGLFGLIKGAVIVFFLMTLLMFFIPKSSPLVKDSRLYPSILTLTGKISVLIPMKIKDDFFNKEKELRGYWRDSKSNTQKRQKAPGEEQNR